MGNGGKAVLFSFFSGAGLLDLGFEFEGFNISFVNEHHGPFLNAYIHSRKKLGSSRPEFGTYSNSIEEFTTGKLRSRLNALVSDAKSKGNIVGFVGGPPCPDFSIGGKNRGHKGENGRLSAIYIETIGQQLPDFFLFENVKGLWQTFRHRRFYEALKQRVQELGYFTAERLINTIEYGVPQDRPRIILIGFKKSLLRDLQISSETKTQEIPDDVFPWKKFAEYPGRSAFEFPWPEEHPFIEDSDLPCPSGIPLTLTVEHWFRKNKVDHHPNAGKFFKPKAGLKRFKSVREGDDSRKSFKRLHRWRYSPTACYGNNEVHLHPYKARRITAAESLAIQSMPPKFEFPDDMTLSDIFKAIGNGVPFVASKMIAKTIGTFLNGK